MYRVMYIMYTKLYVQSNVHNVHITLYSVMDIMYIMYIMYIYLQVHPMYKPDTNQVQYTPGIVHPGSGTHQVQVHRVQVQTRYSTHRV